jgi:hypothetical protein
MKKIYAYYESIPLADQAEEFNCANYWKHSWTANGWEPVMLNRSHAQGSPLYLKLQAKLTKQALGIPLDLRPRVQWITARFARWCALHAAGGGWMSDYDVANIGFTPEQASEYEKDATLYINATIPAYVFYATQDHCNNVIKKFIQDDLIEGDDVLPEAHILGVNSELYPMLHLLHHAKSTPEESRSEIMKDLTTPKDDKSIPKGKSI